MEQTKILAVEDHEDNRHILVLRLQYWGAFAIHEASTGYEVLASIMREPPDVVLLDLKLPGLDGWETARRIRALLTPLNALPIIAVTAQAMPGDREKALAAGCDEYLAKPVVFRELQEMLERVLTRRRPA